MRRFLQSHWCPSREAALDALIDSFALETRQRRWFVLKFCDCKTHDIEHADRATWPYPR
ncbi:MAG: hypothetical protein OEM76_04620 [Gammaproteobacteria bacterium]|nr:hypothetical protein [Gammaproteobacteria bacterium]